MYAIDCTTRSSDSVLITSPTPGAASWFQPASFRTKSARRNPANLPQAGYARIRRLCSSMRMRAAPTSYPIAPSPGSMLEHVISIEVMELSLCLKT